MKTFTPGPWDITWHVAVDGAGRTKYRLPVRIGPVVVGDSLEDLSEPDARLISAAPDLLAALIRCLEWENSDESWTDVMTAAAAAVAKAGVKQ